MNRVAVAKQLVRLAKALVGEVRTGAAGPHTILKDLQDDFKKSGDELDLDKWGSAAGFAPGVDWSDGPEADAIWHVLIDWKAGRKTDEQALAVIKKNIDKAVKANQKWKGMTARDVAKTKYPD